LSFLTKLFVVLVTILAVVLVSLVVPFVANTEDYKDQIAQLKSKNAVLEQQNRVATSSVTEEQDARRRIIEDFKARETVLVNTISSLEGDVTDARSKLTNAQTQIAALSANNTMLASANEQSTAIANKLTEEVRDQRAELLKLQTSVIDLNDILAQRENEIRKLDQLLRVKAEDVTALNEQVATIMANLEKIPPEWRDVVLGERETVTEGRPQPTPFYVEGEITRITTVGDQAFVQINLGRNDRIVENTEFYIGDGVTKDYIGTLVVSVVRENTAAGRITLQKKGELIEVGDRVYSGIQQ